MLDVPTGKTRYYALGVEFQERGSLHVHPFVWILNSPNIGNETEDLVFIEKSISANLPDPLEQSERF